MLYLQWMGMAAKIQQRNEVVNRQCVEVLKRIEADEVSGDKVRKVSGDRFR